MTESYDINNMNYPIKCLEAATGEANKVGADTEASTLAGRGTDGGGDDVEDRENGRGNNAERYDLVPRERAAGHEDRGNRDKEALHEILHGAVNDFRRGVHVYISVLDFFLASRISI